MNAGPSGSSRTAASGESRLSTWLVRIVINEALEIARKIVSHPSMAKYVAFENNPGDKVQSYDEWLDFARRVGQTTYHVIGTCKMGQDPMAVVDDRLRVHGLTGLRVADASIMPTLTSGNTNAPAIMIGEKGAAMILEDHAAG